MARKQSEADLRAVVFFCETVLHLNPTRMDRGTVTAYHGAVVRLKQAHPEAFGPAEEVSGAAG